MLFTYRAVDAQGEYVSGRVHASAEHKVLQTLHHQGYKVVELKPSLDYSAWWKRELAWRPVSSAELVNMTRQLASLLGAGLSLVPALELLHKQTSTRYLQRVLADISAEVAAGESLGASLSKHARVFPPLYINVVKTGELTGALERALTYLADFLTTEQKIKAKIRMAMIYPVILGIVALAVLIFMANVILPNLSTMFGNQTMELPLITRFLLSTAGSGSFIFYGLLLLLALYGVWKFYLPTKPRLKIRLMRKFLAMPLIGKAITAVLAARMTKILGLLLRSGADLPGSLKSTAAVIGNVAFADLLLKAERQVNRGESLTTALADEVLLEPFITQLIATGEESGRLEAMLIYLADYYENAGLLQIDTLLALLEPVLILLAALVVGVLVVGILLPLLGSMEYVVR